MTRVMIVSDTHKKLGNLVEAIQKEGKIDIFIHLGDFEGEDDMIFELVDCEEKYIVPGNNDYFCPYDREQEIQIGDFKVLLTHGHYYYVSLDLATIREEAIARGVDIVMFGHTHRPVIDITDEVTLINPGSISYPRQADRKCTYVMMEIDDNGNAAYYLRDI